MTEPADICRATPPDSVVNAGPCTLRPGHRGTIHQDLHGWQWTTPPSTHLIVSDLDRGESPFGWSSPDPADGGPDRIRTAPDSTRTGRPDTTLTSTDTDPDRPDSTDSQRLALVRDVLVNDGYFSPEEIGPDLAPRVAELLIHYRSRVEAEEAIVAQVSGLASRWRFIADRKDALRELRQACRSASQPAPASEAMEPTVPRALFDETTRRHKGAVARVDELLAVIERARAVARNWERAVLPRSEAHRMLTDLRRALDEPAPAATEATQGTEFEKTVRFLSALHMSAEETITRVIELHEQWVKAGPPPLGTPLARWWDARLVELHNAIQPKE